MGAAASKSPSARRLPVKNAAKRLQQKSPKTPPTPPPASIHPKTPPSFTKSDEILKDSQDPHFSSMLRTLGAVAHGNTPHSHPATSSTGPNAAASPPIFPPTLKPTDRPIFSSVPASVRILRSREQQSDQLAQNPKDYLDIFRIRDVVMMREGANLNGGGKQRKMKDDEIEKRLGLKKGILAKLGDKIGHTGVQVQEQRETGSGEAVEFIR
ncbi:hypothetical protein H072_1764 [Dactylellina haptotyla CBS 200.50]|uniref:Helix-turn-helix domain-containing protein n=1 Tax=Dactylellina haptotyla (strain CBS 200.50) TaxID=1284197 RepID=S8AMS4_DACHA|nr:hypothetical protein H072_1764 [Dactylellina haptotyla CBS 200.50]